MRKEFNRHNQSSKIIYAESLSRNLQKKLFDEIYQKDSVLFVTTQTFYEFYYEKLTSKFKDEKNFHWYICANITEVYHLEMYQKLLLYIEEMELGEGTLIFAAGNYPIYHLCGTIKATSMFIDDFFYIPTTITGLVDSLIGECFLLDGPLSYGARHYVLPERIVYDTMLNEFEPDSAWIDSFYTLVKLGITCQPELLKDLYNASDASRHEVFTPFLETVIETIDNGSSISSQFGLSFGKSFYRIKEAHYLNFAQKKYIGFLLHIYWCVEKNKLSFNFKLFYKWFEQVVDMELSLPIQMTSYDLAESISLELSRYVAVDELKQIGEIVPAISPTITELDKLIDKFRLIKENS